MGVGTGSVIPDEPEVCHGELSQMQDADRRPDTCGGGLHPQPEVNQRHQRKLMTRVLHPASRYHVGTGEGVGEGGEILKDKQLPHRAGDLTVTRHLVLNAGAEAAVMGERMDRCIKGGPPGERN